MVAENVLLDESDGCRMAIQLRFHMRRALRKHGHVRHELMVCQIEEQLIFYGIDVLLQHVRTDALVHLNKTSIIVLIFEQILAEVAIEVL